MTIEQRVLENLRLLPPDEQREALAFIESLARKSRAARPFRSVRGIMNMNLATFERDLAEVRCEMWRDFPRSQPKAKIE